jgi:hypothetical protein
VGLRVRGAGPVLNERESGAGDGSAASGDGHQTAADAEAARVIAEIVAGDRCGGCALEFAGEDSELVGERWYHRTPECAGAARSKATTAAAPKAKGKRRRIKGAETAPDTRGLPQ